MGLVALWHVESPGPEIKFVSPALAGRFLSTASLGKSQTLSCYSIVYGLDQASKPRPRGRGRFWTLSLSTDMDLVTWLLLSAWEPGERGPPSRLLLVAKIWGLGRMRADFEDSQQSLPHFHGSWKRRWHWGCLSCLLNFSAIVAFLVGLCLAFAGQEGVFLHKMMLAL